ALVDCPVAIIADLTHCRIANLAALTVFPSIARVGVSRPSVLIAVAGLTEYPADAPPAALGAVPTVPTAAAARGRITTGAVPGRRTRVHLRPTAKAPQQAADAVEHACSDWHLDHLRHQAAGIAGELVH